ncbi:lipoprotein [Azonexus sp.]|uniref:lipoprotein n=1 Tax=Azonexus sp. TaxID=1872668 RepID=UPI00283903FD|nr:lipoprotein [Azonexus sp.]MDR1996577.1 lipoprotein [Azonexus sp.]
MSRIAALLIVLSLAACGTKGLLELPPGPAPQPLLSGSKQPVAADVSTPSSHPDQ